MVIDQKFELTAFIGEGAMGWVYKGLHRSLGSDIAVKLMKPSGALDEARDQRFAREARAASRLNNPHVISIIDFGSTPGGILYIISEYLRGMTLSSLLLEERALPLERALQIMDQVLSAIEEAHSAGLVHRDLKPDNIIITPMRSGEDFVKILDFGIAKLHDPGGQRLTMQGQLFGTPAYMAPEQIRGQEVTERSDLYSCALILYELLTGQEPFQSESVMEVLSMQLQNTPPPFYEVAPGLQVPAALEALVMRGLSKDPADRFSSAAELREAMHAAVGHRRKTGRVQVLNLCDACGLPIAEGSKFCTECGARQGEVEGPAPAPSLAGRAEPASLGSARPAIEPPEGVASARVRARDYPLVGREAELARLEAFFDGPERAMGVLGPSGAGKTRLLVSARELARSRGLRPLWAGADPKGVRTPWWPVRTMVEQLLGFETGRVAPETVKSRTLAAGLGPGDVVGIAEVLGISVLGDQVEYAVRRREIRAAAVRLIRETQAGREGLCLLLDDADEFDGASLGMLRLLLEGGLGERVFVVMAGERAPLQIPGEPAAIRLGGLGRGAVEELVGHALGGSGEVPLVASALAAVSEGLALHIVEALRLHEEGGLEPDMSLGEVIARRLANLDPGSRAAIEALAVLGNEATREELEGLVGSGSALGKALEILEGRGFVRAIAGGRLEIAHPALAAAASAALDPAERTRLHVRALGLLREAGAGPITLGRHAMGAHLGEESLALLRAAGEEAALQMDDVGAANQFRQALQVARWELLYDEASPEVLDVTLGLGDALRFSKDLEAAALILKEAVPMAAAHPAVQARILRGLGRVHLSSKEEAAGLCLMRDAVRAGIFAGSPDLLCELYADLGRALLDAGRPGEAVAELGEGVTMVTGGEGPNAQRVPAQFWRLLLHLGEAQLRAGSPQAALDPGLSALGQARNAPSILGQARSHFLLGQIFDSLGREAAASEHYGAALAAFRLLGDRKSIVECLLSRAERWSEERHELAEQALSLAREVLWDEGKARATALLTKRPGST
jgi:serine/threonine-protein kinase